MSFVYVLTNKSIIGTIKVGMTTSSPEKRAAELHTTGVPTPFEVAASWRVPAGEHRKYEKIAHKALAKYRVSKNREFFELDADKAIQIINKLIPTPEQIAEKKIRDEEKAKAAHIKEAEQTVLRQKEQKEREVFKFNREKQELLNKKYSLQKQASEYKTILSKRQSLIVSVGSRLSGLISGLFASIYTFIFIWIAVVCFAIYITRNGDLSDMILSVFGFTIVGYFGVMLLMLAVFRLENLLVSIWKSLTRFMLPDSAKLITHADAKKELHSINNEIQTIDQKIKDISQKLGAHQDECFFQTGCVGTSDA